MTVLEIEQGGQPPFTDAELDAAERGEQVSQEPETNSNPDEGAQ